VKKALLESQRQAGEEFQAKRKAEMDLLEARKTAENVRKEAEQHRRRVLELTQQLQEKEVGI
jgi:hypothetical protein